VSSIEDVYDKCLETPNPLPSIDQVATLESTLGVSLPPEYRQFLLERNGGTFNRGKFRRLIITFGESGKGDCVDSLYGIGARKASGDLCKEAVLFDDDRPYRLVPIGYTALGVLLLIVTEALGKDKAGQIWIQFPYDEEYWELCDSFNSLFQDHLTIEDAESET
jgi:hypothetical protein